MTRERGCVLVATRILDGYRELEQGVIAPMRGETDRMAADGLYGHGEDRTIREVLAGLEARGFKGQFVPRAGAQVECIACGKRSPADHTLLRQLCRLEGDSDPADMLAVVALACPRCDALGTAVLGYGPEASDIDAEVLSGLEDGRTN